MSISHGLDSICEQPTKSARDALSEVSYHDTLSCQFARVDSGEQIGESLSKASLGGVQQHSHDDGLAVILDEGSA